MLDELPLIRDSYPGYEDQIERGAELAARCRFLPGGCDADGDPILQMPPAGAGLGGCAERDPDAQLRVEAEAGLRWRYAGDTPEHVKEAWERLEYELRVIKQKRFATYILTVREMTRDRRTCGRGSAASSIVCYALGMTNVDPVRWNLLFDRFLAPERTDPPDIDIDFAWDERDDVQDEIVRRYGHDHVAMVATHPALKHWAALREAARAHGFGDGAITEMRTQLRLAGASGGMVAQPEPWPTIAAAAYAILDAPRHLGLHCGGVLITARPIRELVPVHPAAKVLTPNNEKPAADGQKPVPYHVPTVAWEKDGCEDLGLVKIDVLGNRSLAVIRDCLDDLEEDGVRLTENRLRPMDDLRTREIVAAGATMGCFYIESPAMRQLQAKVGSPEFDRLVVHSSIIRPAGTNHIDTYIKRYHQWLAQGKSITPAQDAEWYPHPALKKLLSESFGILSYQEDVMMVSRALAGFTSAESNQLRKALGRSDALKRLMDMLPRFRDGCLANGVGEDVITLMWNMISSFSGYSFCKAHSASYAVVSFECAYLKAHHPAVFMARVIANQGGFYRTVAYVEEARRLKVEIRGPCVLRSRWETRCEGPGAIRIGLQLVKGLSRATADRLIAAREQAPFRGIRDAKQRGRVAADELRALCDAGTLDAIAPAVNHAQRAWLTTVVARERESFITPETPGAQAVLDLVAKDADDPPTPLLRDLTLDEVRRRRWACLGLLPDAHPLCLWRLPPRRIHCRDITPRWKGRRVSVIAWPIADKEVSATYSKDRAGNPLPELRYESMCFVTFEDETALLETVWFPDAFRAYGSMLYREEPLRLHGKVDVAFGVATLTVERAEVVG
jgi:DNA polymerase-3 subunit alpha/error-prone DNA polymerase